MLVSPIIILNKQRVNKELGGISTEANSYNYYSSKINNGVFVQYSVPFFMGIGGLGIVVFVVATRLQRQRMGQKINFER